MSGITPRMIFAATEVSHRLITGTGSLQPLASYNGDRVAILFTVTPIGTWTVNPFSFAAGEPGLRVLIDNPLLMSMESTAGLPGQEWYGIASGVGVTLTVTEILYPKERLGPRKGE